MRPSARVAATAFAFMLIACESSTPNIAPPTALTRAERFALVARSEKVRFVRGFEDGLVTTAATTVEEDAALDNAVSSFHSESERGTAGADLLTPFEDFLVQHPRSGWSTALQANLGFFYYKSGFFTRAIRMWERAWQGGQSATAPQARALVDRAAGELARMHARVGRADAVDAVVAAVGTRPIIGSATETLAGAKEGAFQMRHNPGVAFLCGPKALKSLLEALGRPAKDTAFLDAERSGPQGYSLQELSQLADRSLKHTVVFRKIGEPIPVPSVIHWGLNHYAAIVSEIDGRYRIADPTFGSDLVVSNEAIDEEASGYFLIPAERPAQSATARSIAWRQVDASEASSIRGMGYTQTHDSGHTKQADTRNRGPRPPTPDGPQAPLPPEASPSAPECVGMCAPDVNLMALSLRLSDTPLGYQPQIGPAAFIRATYNQREDNEPAVPPFSNLGPKWSLGLLSYIEDDPAAPGVAVKRRVGGGGTVSYTGATTIYTTALPTMVFKMEAQSGAVLSRYPASGASATYTLTQRDGSKLVYTMSDGAASGTRRIYLSAIQTAQGRSVSFGYSFGSGTVRIIQIADSSQQLTAFEYSDASNPLRVTKVRDPFGRSATFAYDAQGRLSSITDAVGIASVFTYRGTTSDVIGLTTPYGDHAFDYGGDGGKRWLRITDPQGQTEYFETKYDEPLAREANARAPSGFLTDLNLLRYRNTFHWNAKTYADFGANYTKAVVYHWLHTSDNRISGILESVKYPLENRIWYAYPSQTSTLYEGKHGGLSVVSRWNDDVQEERTTLEYDDFGNVITETDPQGRITRSYYSADGLDLLRECQVSSSTGTCLFFATNTYDNHALATTYGLDGRTWSKSYYPNGQLKTETDPNNRVITYNYDTKNRLSTVVNENGVVVSTFVYPESCNDGYPGPIVDNCEIPASTTDSTGHTVRDSYDKLDRLKKATYPDGTFEAYEYTALDLTKHTDRNGRSTVYTFDKNRRLISVQDPLLNVDTYDYFPDGSLRGIGDSRGWNRTFEVDLQGRPTFKIFGLLKRTAFTYDGSGRLASSTDTSLSGDQVSYKSVRYHLDGRVRRETDLAGTQVTYDWDPFWPRIATVHDRLRDYAYTYHPPVSLGAGRVATDGNASYWYDSRGRVASRRLAFDTTSLNDEAWTYDSLGRLQTHTTRLGTFTYEYFGETSQVARVLLGGTALSTYTYDTTTRDHRLIGISHSVTPQLSFAYSYTDTATAKEDPYNIRQVVEQRGTTTKTWKYAYDNGYRLRAAAPVGSSIIGYTYDVADNLRTGEGRSFTYNVDDEINSAGYWYDGAGGLIADSQQQTQITWNGRGEVASVTQPSKPPYTYAYDADGHVATSNDGTSTYQWHWCQDGTLCARSKLVGSNWVLAERYYPEGQYSEERALAMLTLKDHIGSTRSIANPADRTTYAGFDFTPYGTLIAAVPGSSANLRPDFMFAGLYQERTGGNLYVSRSRFYDAASGRFQSRDPIGEAGGTNLYGYALGNPITYADPSGHMPAAPAIPFFAGTAVCGPACGAVAVGVAIGIGYLWCTRETADEEDEDDDPCWKQRESDRAVCRAIGRRRGKQRAALCYASAEQRYSACLRGRPLPPLDTWNN